MKPSLCWIARETPVELRSVLRIIGEEYPVIEGRRNRAVRLRFVRAGSGGGCRVELEGGTAQITYSGTAHASRGVGALLAGLVTEDKPYSDSTPFQTLGIMLDCSRNAVMTVEHVQKWLRRLVLLGYNMVMLYTEDTYELPGEPWFGYKRGAYSASELKVIDSYAAKLGIEIIPCIQTLGHLEQILKHGAYSGIKDTSSVLMVGESKTYALIEKMVSHWKAVCRTNRIHIGMDETHDLGRGRYLDLYGYRQGFDLFNEHLARVTDICRKHGLEPMIWSDMYFRLGCKSGTYYDKATVIPERVVRKIPHGVDLVYWDYYHNNREFYAEWIERHRRLGKEPLVGSGIWTWNKYWYDHNLTTANAGPCIEACRESGVKELFFTMWGDNGAYCDHDSAFAGMVYCADRAYGRPAVDAMELEKRFAGICGGSYAVHLTAGQINGPVKGFNPGMWEDPVFETRFRSWAADDIRRMAAVARAFSDLASELKPYAGSSETGNLKYAYATAYAFAQRYQLFVDLLRAYRKRDKKALRGVMRRIPKAVDAVSSMAEAFRQMWMSHNKPEGIETIQARFGMLEARYGELKLRLSEYLAGKVQRMAELEYKCPPA